MERLRSPFVAVLLVTVLSTVLASAASAQEKDSAADAAARRQGHLLVVGFDRDLPPYSFVDDDGEPAGFTVDLLEAIAEVIDVELDWRPLRYPEALAALASGEVDVVPNLPSTAALDVRFAITLPHSEQSDVIFIPADDTDVLAFDEVAGKRVLVRADDPAAEYLEGLAAEGFDVEVVPHPTFSEVLRHLAVADGDAALLPPDTGRRLSRKLRLSGEVRITGPPIEGYGRSLSLAVRDDREDLREDLDQALVIVTNNRDYLQVYNTWFRSSDEVALEEVLRWVAWVGTPLAVLVAFFAGTSWLLRRTVARRTAELEREMDERRRLEEKFRQTQKLESLGVLAGGIAHDFNNQLMGVLGNAGLARLETPEGSPVRKRLADIEKSARQSAELCQQMLAYSGRGAFILRPIKLSELVEGMAHLLEVSISKKARLERDLAADLPVFEGDPTQIRQVVMNLVTNASEALGDGGGTVRLTTGATTCDREDLDRTTLGDELPEGRYLFLEVSDDGCGMDAETRERMFDPFFTTKFTGRGLGLAATLGIVRGHHGTLEVTSAPGRGTRFRVLFPCAPEVSEAPEVPAEAGASGWKATEEAPWPEGGGKVLVVDDEAMVANVARQTLELAGYEVLVASDGVEALELFRRHAEEIDVVVLDLTMPRMNGQEAFGRLRSIKDDVKVVISSGYSEQEVSLLFDGGRGAVSFLQKPYAPPELLAKVREAALGEVAGAKTVS